MDIWNKIRILFGKQPRVQSYRFGEFTVDELREMVQALVLKYEHMDTRVDEISDPIGLAYFLKRTNIVGDLVLECSGALTQAMKDELPDYMSDFIDGIGHEEP